MKTDMDGGDIRGVTVNRFVEGKNFDGEPVRYLKSTLKTIPSKYLDSNGSIQSTCYCIFYCLCVGYIANIKINK